MGDRVRVIGVGNPDRGDDGIGLAVAAAVADLAPPNVDVAVSVADPSRLIDRWEGADLVLVVDAVVNGSAPGTITVIDPVVDAIPADASAVSSHGMGVASTIELARSLGRVPERLVLVGVTGELFEGTGLSQRVREAVEEAAAIVLEVAANA